MNSQEVKHQQLVIEWKERIMACRSSGMSVKAWCQQEGYSCKTYYRWEREVLGLAGEQLSRTETALPIQPNSMTPVFAEIAPLTHAQTDAPQAIASVRIGKTSVEVYQGAGADIVTAIFKGLHYAK